MRKTFLSLALSASALGAAACSAQGTPQTTPQTAAQANAAVAAQIEQEAAPVRARGMRGPGMRGGGMMRADANNDGIVTRAEALAAADARFARMDANGDGTVTAEDMAMRREARDDRAAAGGRTRPPGAGRGGAWGQGGDRTMTKADAEARAMQRFDRMDTDHDGTLDRAELAAARPNRGDMPPPPPADDNGQ